MWNDWSSVPWYFATERIDNSVSHFGGGATPPGPPAETSASSTAQTSDTTTSSGTVTGTTTITGGVGTTNSKFSTTTTFNDSANLSSASPPGFSTSQPNTAGSLQTGTASFNQTNIETGSNTQGVINANFDNNGSETATYSFYTTTNTTPASNQAQYTLQTSRSMSTSTSETGSYTTSAPGSAAIMPTPDNPGGYATFNETRDDNNSVTNTIAMNWTGTNSSETAWQVYTANANSSLTSDKTITVNVANHVDTQSGTYSLSGGKGETSNIHRKGSVGSPAFGASYDYNETWGNSRGLIDTGGYPGGGTSAETVVSSLSGSETDTLYGNSAGHGWTATNTGTWSWGGNPVTTVGPDGVAQSQAPADTPDPAPDEAANGKAPWYDNDWTDWINPAAWVASGVMGVWNDLHGAYEVLNKDHGAGWDNLIAAKGNAIDALSKSGDVAAYRNAYGTAVGTAARDVLNDAAKWTAGYTTGLQLLAGAPGAMRAGIGALEGGVNMASSLGGMAKGGLQSLIGVVEKACFAAGTPIQTPEAFTLIEMLREGDCVLSRDEDDPNAPVSIEMVHKVFKLQAQIWELHIAGRRIDTTAEHPFYVVGFGWTPLNRIKPGDILKGRDDQLLAVDGVAQTNRTETVYTVSVEPGRTFFVGSEEWGFAVWVHNRLCRAALERDLILASRPSPGAGYQIAHIVPWGNFADRPIARDAIRRAKAVMARAGGSLDALENIFWTNSPRHNGTHTDRFFIFLAKYLEDAETAGTVQSQLRNLGVLLESGLMF